MIWTYSFNVNPEVIPGFIVHFYDSVFQEYSDIDTYKVYPLPFTTDTEHWEYGTEKKNFINW